jgi:two-component system sensor histidine kinase/response regulator
VDQARKLDDFAQAQGPAAALPDRKPNILVVDDRKENLLATEKVLRPLNASIFNASSGNEALKLILRHRFAVVLLDVQMPEMDGFETAGLMQEHESMHGVPIIFVTAISKEDRYATRAAEIGAVDYVSKPINSEILRSKVKVYLDLYMQREEIIALNTNLRESNEELERFAYICSHDMQEPVRMMNTFAGLLAENYETLLDVKGAKYVNLITSNADRMRKMIQDILTFARVGREEIKLEPVDCNEIASEVLAEFEGIIAETNAVVTFGELPQLQTSPTLIRVLFQNLLSNGLKFQNREKRPEIQIRAEQQQHIWMFSVCDNGIGIEPAFHDRIFTIFQRFHRKEIYPGTGIGLCTCRKFIRLCGGDIGFESVPGEGTRFFFSLPQKGN